MFSLYDIFYQTAARRLSTDLRVVPRRNTKRRHSVATPKTDKRKICGPDLISDATPARSYLEAIAMTAYHH